MLYAFSKHKDGFANSVSHFFRPKKAIEMCSFLLKFTENVCIFISAEDAHRTTDLRCAKLFCLKVDI